ncbi:MAG TPA: hypothetical protein VFS20_06370 [Longimicrobium sp.]|nr:hypothetical protein [Longimicrobium sp.]
MFRDFFVSPDGADKTTLTYMNLYDSTGTFLYQLWWDPATRTIKRGNTERY